MTVFTMDDAASFEGLDIRNLNYARHIFEPRRSVSRRAQRVAPTIDHIIQTVCDHFNVARADLLSPRRLKYFVQPRHLAFWLCRELTTASYPEIGRMFSNRDHTTIMHGCEQVDFWIADGRPLGDQALELRERMQSAAQ